VAQVRDLLADPARRKQMVEHNYRLGQEHFSFEKLSEFLQGLLEVPHGKNPYFHCHRAR